MIGWPLITVFVLCIAASDGRDRIGLPDAGGLYLLGRAG
jgi:hypothetical protein